MEIILVSDNHGRRSPLKQVRMAYPRADRYFHAGDSELFPDEMEGFVSVCGNNDSLSDYPLQRIFELEGHRILLIHGHRLLWMDQRDLLVEKAKQNQCDLVFFGHTHVFEDEIVEGVHLINPGSLSYNRDLSPCCFATVTIIQDEVIARRVNLLELAKE